MTVVDPKGPHPHTGADITTDAREEQITMATLDKPSRQMSTLGLGKRES